MRAGSSAAVIVLCATKPATTRAVSSIKSRVVAMLALRRHGNDYKVSYGYGHPLDGGRAGNVCRAENLSNTKTLPIKHRSFTKPNAVFLNVRPGISGRFAMTDSWGLEETLSVAKAVRVAPLAAVELQQLRFGLASRLAQDSL